MSVKRNVQVLKSAMDLEKNCIELYKSFGERIREGRISELRM